MLDFGHGGHDSGAVARTGEQEKNLVLQIGQLLVLKLKRCGIDVHTTRNNDSFVSLSDRAKKANQLGVNAFISLHCNSSDNSSAQGVETFAYKEQYANLATKVQNAIINSKNYTKNRGVKTANFAVLRETSMSACLVELAFISNDTDLNILRTKQDELATAVAKGICDYLGVEYNGGTNKPLYIVATGAYSDINNAKRDMENLKNKGINAYIHQC